VQKYQQILREIKCPVCSTNCAHRLWEINSKQAAQHFVLYEKHPERFLELVLHIESLWGKNTCEVVQCDKCGFCFSNPYIAGDERFYRLAYDRAGYPKWKWEFQQTYNVLNKHSRSDLKLVEVGAGDGAFVRKIAGKIIPKKNILCTEFSEYGRNQIEKFGVKSLSEDIRNFSNRELKESIDVVCMFQVLEHMDRLKALFTKLNWLMKRGGSLFIAVPNPRRIEFNELNNALLDMPPNHIGRWNKECFEAIGMQNGFEIEDYRIEEFNFPSLAKEFVIYRFLRKSQRRGSFENRIQKIKNPHLNRIMQIAGVVINLINAIPALTKLNSGMGTSQWVHFIKVK
jgi:SAM-dependent methyltransferase